MSEKMQTKPTKDS